MTKIELLSPVGSPETVEAAVQSGANAVYLGFGDFNARRNAKNFTLEQLEEAVNYCHLRNVSVFLTLNTLLSQRELQEAEKMLRPLIDIGIDAVIVQDMGIVDLIQTIAPQLEIHASTQCTIHSLEGVLQAQKLGFSRVVLSRELSRKEMAYIAKHSPLPLEVFVHGAMCMSYSGQCYLSALVGERSGNRGLCAQPCRLDYGWDGQQGKGKFPMSLKDMSLGMNLQELEEMGIASLKIEGRMKRPEYVAIVTKIYATALAEGRIPTAEEAMALEQAFSRQGFTQGYYEGETGRDMFGTRQSQPEPKELFGQTRRDYQGKELRKTQVSFDLTVEETLNLTLTDPQGNQVSRSLEGIEPAQNKALTPEVATAQLQRTGGTPFELVPNHIHIAPDLALPLSKLNHLRRDMLEELGETIIAQKKYQGELQPMSYIPTPPKAQSRPLAWTVEVTRPEQVTPELLAQKPDLIYLPYHFSPDIFALCQESQVPVVMALPSILSDVERENLLPVIQEKKAMGIEEVLVGTIDSYHWAQSLGFALRGDYNLNLYNNHSLKKFGDLLSAMPSFELKLPQIRDLDKTIPLELMFYGNLPLMTTKNCMISNEFGKSSCQEKKSGCQSNKGKCHKDHSLYDRKKMSFPVEGVEGGRNQLLNAVPLYLADKTKKEFLNLGVWAGRLRFSRECPGECVHILKDHQEHRGNAPEEFTRGLYYRGVE